MNRVASSSFGQPAFDIVGFDLDGTLVDTAGDLGQALNHVLQLAGRQGVELATARQFVGGGTRVMLERALAATGGMLAPDEVEKLSEALVTYYEAHIADHSQLYPGGQSMLDMLASQDVRLAVVTNKLESLAVKLLEELGLAKRFFTILGGDTLGYDRAKPAPDLLLEMLARAGGKAPSRAAFVGDSIFDTRAARAAKIPCIAVSFGFSDAPAHTLGADAVIDHFDELLPTLDRLAQATSEMIIPTAEELDSSAVG